MSDHKLTLYWLPVSHNARVVWYFASASGIHLDLKVVNLLAAEHKSPDFLEINPLGKLPALHDAEKNIKLYEGTAIIHYLAKRFPSSLYPSEDAKQLERFGKIDAAYEYVRHSLWHSIYGIWRETFAKPVLFKAQTDDHLLKSFHGDLEGQLKLIDEQFFKEDPHFVIGKELSLADVALATIFLMGSQAQPAVDYSKHDKVHKWWENIQKTEHFKKAHDEPVFAWLKVFSESLKK